MVCLTVEGHKDLLHLVSQSKTTVRQDSNMGPIGSMIDILKLIQRDSKSNE